MSQVVFDYRPLPVHYPFHQSLAYEAVAFGGYGSGKSYALCAEAIAFMLENAGVEILVCRKTIPSLRDTTEAIFMSLLPTGFFDQCETARMGGHYESITFPNGSKAMFRGLDDWMKLKSLSLAAIFFDEVDEIDPETYEGMLSRVRQTRRTPAARKLGHTGPVPRRYVRSASNPAGQNWVWQRFVGPDALEHCDYFTSTSLDNPFLPLDYVDSLLAMPDPWVRRYVLCGFDDFAGAIYPDWSSDTHVIEPYAKYPADAWFWMGMDPGTADPTAGVWCVYDAKRNALVAVAEYQEPGLAATKHAEVWRRIEARGTSNEHRIAGPMRPLRRRIADPTVATRDRGTNTGLDDTYRRLGFNFELGPRLIKDRMPMLGLLIYQRRFLATTECPRLIQQLTNYRYEDLTPAQRAKGTEAKPLKKDVHLVDAAQYISSRYLQAPAIELNAKPEETPEQQHAREIHEKVKRQIASGRTATINHDAGSMVV